MCADAVLSPTFVALLLRFCLGEREEEVLLIIEGSLFAATGGSTKEILAAGERRASQWNRVGTTPLPSSARKKSKYIWYSHA